MTVVLDYQDGGTGPTGLRIGRFLPGGQFQAALDVENGATIQKMKQDGYVWTPGERQAILTEGDARYDGARGVADRHGNGTLAVEWLLRGGSPEAVLQSMEDMLAEVDRTGEGKYLEVTPPGCSATYLELRDAADSLPRYELALFRREALRLGITFACAPLPLGPPCDVIEDWDTDDHLPHWNFIEGGLSVDTAGGLGLRGPSPAEVTAFYTNRGYEHGDNEITLQFDDSVVADCDQSAILKAVSEDTYLRGTALGTNLAIYAVIAGTPIAIETAVVPAPAAGSHWLRFRQEGNDLTLEYFEGLDEPGPATAPDEVVTHNLTGTYRTTFGVGTVGGYGFSWRPQDDDERLRKVTVKPWTYNGRSFPAAAPIELDGPIPGEAPAPTGIEITTDTATPPHWARVCWTRRPSSGSVRPPLGTFDMGAEDIVGDRSGFAPSSSSPYSGGLGGQMLGATAAGAGFFSAAVLVDPSRMIDADDFSPYELSIEVMARVLISDDLVGVAAAVFNLPEIDDYGVGSPALEPGDRLAPVVTGNDRFRKMRLGTLVFSIDPADEGLRRVTVVMACSAGSSGPIGLDYLHLAPSRSRCMGPTGKEDNATTYPRFISATTEMSKTILPNLRGRIKAPGVGSTHSHGLMGSRPTLPPGDVDVDVLLGNHVPDDPTVNGNSESLATEATIHFAVQPSWRHLRP